MNRFDGPKSAKKQLFPVTKIVIKPKVMPSDRPDVIRLRFLERPYRWYRGLTYHWQAFMKTVIISFFMVYPPYCLFYRLQKNISHAEVMGRMNEGFHSDELKRQIRDFKARKNSGLVETYEDQTGEKIEEGNLGLAKTAKGNEANELRKSQEVYFDEEPGSLAAKRAELLKLKQEQERRLKAKDEMLRVSRNDSEAPMGWHIM